MIPDEDVSPELKHMDEVDRHPSVDAATEGDEEQVLAGLYGEPDTDGFYTGPEVS